MGLTVDGLALLLGAALDPSRPARERAEAEEALRRALPRDWRHSPAGFWLVVELLPRLAAAQPPFHEALHRELAYGWAVDQVEMWWDAGVVPSDHVVKHLEALFELPHRLPWAVMGQIALAAQSHLPDGYRLLARLTPDVGRRILRPDVLRRLGWAS